MRRTATREACVGSSCHRHLATSGHGSRQVWDLMRPSSLLALIWQPNMISNNTCGSFLILKKTKCEFVDPPPHSRNAVRRIPACTYPQEIRLQESCLRVLWRTGLPGPGVPWQTSRSCGCEVSNCCSRVKALRAFEHLARVARNLVS